MRAALSLCEGEAVEVLDWAPRALGAGFAMTLAVRGVQAMLPYDGSAGLAAAQLFASVVVGAAVYPLVLLMLWRLSGRPESAESRILNMARGFLPARLVKA